MKDPAREAGCEVSGRPGGPPEARRGSERPPCRSGNLEGGPPVSATPAWVLTLPVAIRACVREDLPKLEWFGLFTRHREIFRAPYASQERGENLMLVAEVNAFPAGQVWVDLVRKRAESAGVLWAVRVFPFLQGLGIGARLIAAAEQALRARGFAYAELGVEKPSGPV